MSELCSRFIVLYMNNHNRTGEVWRVYIAGDTLEMKCANCDNLKEVAYGVDMDFSNFLKQCKMQADIRLGTCARCAAAFDMDIVMFYLPKGLIDVVQPVYHKNRHYATIKEEDLLLLLYKPDLDDIKAVFWKFYSILRFMSQYPECFDDILKQLGLSEFIYLMDRK